MASITIHPQVGISVCLRCPYDDCLGDQKCVLIKEEVLRIRVEEKELADKIKAMGSVAKKQGKGVSSKTLDQVADIVMERGYISATQLVNLFPINHSQLATLERQGVLELSRPSVRSKGAVKIVGVYPLELGGKKRV